MLLNNQKRHKIIAASLFVPGALALVASPIIASELTYAACNPEDTTGCVYVDMGVDEVMSITNIDTLEDVNLGDAQATDAVVSAGQAVKVTTNHAGGYKLIVKAIGTDTNGDVTNKLLRRNKSGTALNDTGFDSVSSKTEIDDMANATWGFGVNSSRSSDIGTDDKYLRPIATTDSGVVNYTTAPTSEDTTTLFYGAKGGAAKVAGKYSAIVQITAIANDGGSATIYGD